MSELIEMVNAIAEVPLGESVLVNGKKVTGSVCKDGSLHNGWQLAGKHKCACPAKKAPKKKPAAKKKVTKKKGKK